MDSSFTRKETANPIPSRISHKANLAAQRMQAGVLRLSRTHLAGFLIYEHMDADEATDAFLKESGMNAPAGVGYCLAVRK